MENSKDYKKVLSHPKIKEIIEEKKLNKNQIKEAFSYFLQIIDEEENESAFTTEISVLENGAIIKSLKPSKKTTKSISKDKKILFKEISLINENYEFSPNFLNNKSEKKDIELSLYVRETVYNISHKLPLKGLYLHGKSNVDKAFFCSAFCNLFVSFSEKKTVSYFNLSDLNFFIVSKFNTSNNHFEYKKELENIDVLIIDSIGTEKMSEWFLTNIFIPIINYRLNNSKLTIFNSDFPPDKLELDFYESYKKIITRERLKILFSNISKLCPTIINLR
ncbi:MAG: DnaA ATPase domain-containing protein [Metamycoplasmataceae bacterium]